MAITIVGFDHVQVVDFSPQPASGSLFLITGVAKIEFRGSATPDSDGWTRDTCSFDVPTPLGQPFLFTGGVVRASALVIPATVQNVGSADIGFGVDHTSVIVSDPINGQSKVTLTSLVVTRNTQGIVWRLAFRVNVHALLSDWEPLGPSFEIHEPTNFSTKNTGRVNWIETTTNFDGQGTPAIYLATAGGGVWRSSDFTSSSPTWLPLTDHLPLQPEKRDGIQSISSLAVDPHRPGTIYAGTGDTVGFLGYGHGQGILKSTDGGNSWSLLGRSWFAYSIGISRLIVDPTPAGSPSNLTGNTLYAVGGADPSGSPSAWKSPDGGVTWSVISSGIAASAIAVQDLEYTLDGTGTNLTLYMAVRDASGSHPQVNGFYSSSDGGMSWRPMIISSLSDMFTGQPVPPDRMGPIKLAALRTAGAPPQVCATVGDAPLDTQLGGHRLLNVFRFGGGFWIPIGNTMPFGVGNNKILNQDGYDQPIGVSNSGAIYVGATQPFYQSVDGGSTWEDVELGTNGIKPHTDFHAIAFFGSAVYVGTDGGPYRFNPLPNFQLGRSTWDDLNSSLQTNLVLGVGVHATDPSKILIAQPDNGTALRKPDGSFTYVGGGDTSVAKFDPHPENADYAYFIDGGGIQRSSDGGRTWVGLPFPGSHPPGAVDLAFYPTVSPDPSRIVAATNPVFETRDSRAASVVWTQISPSAPNLLAGGEAVTTIAYAYPDIIYAGFANNNQIYKTTDDGATWTRIDQNVIVGTIEGLVTNPFNPFELCVASTVNPAPSGQVGTIFRTTDGGKSWVNLTGNLPGVTVTSIALLPTSASEDPWLFVGTSVGVYVATSLQGNVQWTKLAGSSPRTDLPDGQVTSLYINPRTRLLVAGIRGRGVWGVFGNG